MNTIVRPATLERLHHQSRISAQIRQRLEDAGVRWHANDNISDFIEPGELESLEAEVVEAVQGVLDALVIDAESDHNSRDTARRVAKMYVREVFAGRYNDAPQVTRFPNDCASEELIVVGPVQVRSACSHHLCPVVGKIWVGVLPDRDSELIGLSKYARLADWVMSRPQIQEEALVQLADLLESVTEPRGLALKMVAEHFCMSWRGVKDSDSTMTSLVMRGVFKEESALRAEFLSLT